MMASGVGLIVTPLLVARYEGSVNKADLFRDGDTGTRPEAQSRVRADGPTKSYQLEHRQGQRWISLAAFAVNVGACKPE